MDKPVIILGANGLGKAAMEAFESNNVVVYGFLDDKAEREGEEIGQVTVLGSLDDNSYYDLIGKDCEAFIATEEIELRKGLVESLVNDKKTMPVNSVHKSSLIAESAAIGHGNYIGATVNIGPNATIGNHLVLNTGAIIDYDTKIADFVQVGAGSIINSGADIEEDVFIGSGVTVVSGIKIGKGARVGAGSVVISDIAAGATVFGNPAKPVE
jgi:sugar O-acyltransferase (sialic acid O-acetyltransferase NeuD family)